MRSYVKKEGGKIQRQILAMLRQHTQPLEGWWIAEQMEIESKYVGETAKNIKAAFQKARETQALLRSLGLVALLGLLVSALAWYGASVAVLRRVDALLVATVGELLWEQHAAKLAAKAGGDPWSPWHARDGWRMNLSAARTISFLDGETLVDARIRYQGDQWMISINGETTAARGKKLSGDRFAVELDDRRLIASVVAVDDKRSVFLQGATHTLLRDDPLHRVDAGDSHGGGLTAPMPGKVVALLAQPGQTVDKGTPLLILEAMKMEHTITAPTAGTIKAFCYAAGEQVSDGAALVEFAEQA